MALEATISKSTEEMDTQFNQELELVLTDKYPLDDFLDDWGMSFEELLADDSIGYPQEESLMRLKGIEGTHQSMNEGINPEWEGEGITSELIPGETMIATLLEKAGLSPEYAAMVGAVATKRPMNMTKGTKGMLSSGKGSKVQVKPKEKFDQSKGAKHKVILDKPKVIKADKPKGMTTQRKAELTTAGGLTTALGLSGLRGKDGSLQPAEPTPEVVTPDVEPEAPSNQFGYHKQEGQNFWTVDNDDSYWDTHDIEGSSAFEEAPLKQQPQQELDWDFWFKQ